jgi:hypothetical protein
MMLVNVRARRPSRICRAGASSAQTINPFFAALATTAGFLCDPATDAERQQHRPNVL